MKAIVTGASGFIGSRLVAKLVSGGYKVAAIGRKRQSQILDFRKRFLEGATYIEVDLDEINRLEEILLLEGFHGKALKFFFHLAWGGRCKLSDLDVDSQSKNVARTVDTYNLAGSLGAERYIFSGTMEEAFGEKYTMLDYKVESKYNRHVVYALAKIAARNALRIEYRKGTPDILFGTNSHVMGPGDDKDSFLQMALLKMLQGENVSMSSGEQIFDVINVSDCAEAYVRIAESGINLSSYWIGSGSPKQLRDYVIEMNQMYPNSSICFGSQPFNDVVLEKSIFSTELLAKDTGFYPYLSFSDSVLELAEYLKSVILP